MQISVLHILRGKNVVEVLRWVEFPISAECASGTITWTTGFGQKQTHTLAYTGPWAPLDTPKFRDCLLEQLHKLGLVSLGLRRENAKRALWALAGVKAVKIVDQLATPRRLFLLLPEGATLPGVDDIESLIVVSDVEPGLPMCLRDEHLGEPPVCTARDSTGSSLVSLPSPGYWPITCVYVRDSQDGLLAAITRALEGNSVAKLVVIKSPNSTFLRDYWINIFHGSKKLQESVSTTKTGGLGFSDNSSVLNMEITTVPPGAASSGFGFGGNFLSCEVDDKVHVFHGRCLHQFGTYADDRFMVEQLLARLGGSVDLVSIDTGWLKVGHVDEIMSFPRPKVALLASPDLYAKRASGQALKHPELNKRIETKIKAIAKLLMSLRIDCIPLPVWFAPVINDAMHVTSVRGNAVNCIYIGAFSIHSQSGPTDGEKRPNGASGAVDVYVEDVMKKLGYTSLFVDMSAANDEGGGGGNVHCATYTTHRPPD